MVQKTLHLTEQREKQSWEEPYHYEQLRSVFSYGPGLMLAEICLLMLNFVKSFCFIYWDDRMIFILHFISVVYHLY